jgi:hypothetical protein
MIRRLTLLLLAACDQLRKTELRAEPQYRVPRAPARAPVRSAPISVRN